MSLVLYFCLFSYGFGTNSILILQLPSTLKTFRYSVVFIFLQKSPRESSNAHQPGLVALQVWCPALIAESRFTVRLGIASFVSCTNLLSCVPHGFLSIGSYTYFGGAHPEVLSEKRCVGSTILRSYISENVYYSLTLNGSSLGDKF